MHAARQIAQADCANRDGLDQTVLATRADDIANRAKLEEGWNSLTSSVKSFFS
jgi:hypothetical protein